jgi:hypothetical protein
MVCPNHYDPGTLLYCGSVHFFFLIAKCSQDEKWNVSTSVLLWIPLADSFYLSIPLYNWMYLKSLPVIGKNLTFYAKRESTVFASPGLSMWPSIFQLTTPVGVLYGFHRDRWTYFSYLPPSKKGELRKTTKWTTPTDLTSHSALLLKELHVTFLIY